MNQVTVASLVETFHRVQFYKIEMTNLLCQYLVIGL